MQLDFSFASPADLDAVTALEAACFPAAEACGREQFARRIAAYPESFLLARSGGTLVGMINGACNAATVIADAMYEDTAFHCPDAPYQMIFGLDTAPAFRRQGVAAALMEQFIALARQRGKKGLVLACKDRLIPYYQQFGYRLLGVSAGSHGGAVWNDMLLEFCAD